MLSWLPSAPRMFCKRSPCWPGSSLIREVLGLAGTQARTASLSSSSSAAFLGVHHHRLSPGGLPASGHRWIFLSTTRSSFSTCELITFPPLPYPPPPTSLSAEGARIHPATHRQKPESHPRLLPPGPYPVLYIQSSHQAPELPDYPGSFPSLPAAPRTGSVWSPCPGVISPNLHGPWEAGMLGELELTDVCVAPERKPLATDLNLCKNVIFFLLLLLEH